MHYQINSFTKERYRLHNFIADDGSFRGYLPNQQSLVNKKRVTKLLFVYGKSKQVQMRKARKLSLNIDFGRISSFGMITQKKDELRQAAQTNTQDERQTDSDNIGQLNDSPQKNRHSIGQLKVMVREMNVREKLKMFVSKLKRNKITKRVPMEIQQEEEDLERSAERFEHIDNEGQIKVTKGYALDKEMKLAISLANFLTIVYMQILSSFHCFLPQFRDKEMFNSWVLTSEYICLAVVLIKIISYFVVQRTVYGYRLISLRQIFLYYAFSLEFMLDGLILVSSYMLVKNKMTLLPAYLTFSISLVRLSFTQRIDQLISSHVMVTNTMRQYLALIRLLMANLFVAHLIGTIFLAVADSEEGYNWMVKYGINDSPWQEKYIYSIYWAVTIMSTCGFGDIVVTNANEAGVTTFVMIFGCLILSYNITQVATIFFHLQQSHEELRKNLVILKKIAHVSKISNKLHRSMADYLIHSSEVKLQYEIEQSRNLIAKLPQNLRGDYLQQSSNIFFSEMPIISLLRTHTKRLLIERLNYEILSPGEYITHKRMGMEKVYFLRMGTVGLAYKKRGANLNGLVLDRIDVDDIGVKNPVLLNAFLFNRSRKQNYDIVCDSFCNVAHIEFAELIRSIREYEIDFEFFRQYYDSEQGLQEEWAFNKCNECNERHSIFSCPKISFLPLRSTIFLRNAFKKIDQHGLQSEKALKDFELHLQRYLIDLRENKNRGGKSSPLKQFSSKEKAPDMFQQRLLSQRGYRNRQEWIMKIRKMDRSGGRDNQDVDVAWNFESYFKKHNPKELIGKCLTSKKHGKTNQKVPAM